MSGEIKTGTPLLKVEELKKYFHTPKGELHAVDNVSFTLEKGQTLGVVGESGCGKSTLGRVLLRLVPHTSGKVLFEGEDVLGYSKNKMIDMRKEMQMIFQDPYASLNPRMTVSEIISEPMKVCKTIRNAKERDNRVFELMETVGLADRFINTYPHEMDGGRRQRVGIARALALDPKFIVCDEPVSALDVSIQAQILNLMMDLQEQHGFSYMFITHNLSVVKHISNHIMVMYLGQVVEMAETEELFRNPMHPYTQALMDAIPVASLSRRGKERKLIKGEVTSPINPKPGCRFAARCPCAKDSCVGEDVCLKEETPGHFVACRLFE